MRLVVFQNNIEPTPSTSQMEINNFVCEICSTNFESLEALNLHYKNMHTKKKSFHCGLCGKEFNHYQSLKLHVTRHVEDATSEESVDEDDRNLNFVPPKNLGRNFELEHDLESNSEVNDFSCKICNRIFLGKQNLEDHLRLHNSAKPFICELCPKNFKSKLYLKGHVKRCHTINKNQPKKMEDATSEDSAADDDILSKLGVKKFKCKICKRIFFKRRNLKFHLRLHNSEKPFVCDKCPKTFKTRKYLKGHVKRCHTSDTYKLRNSCETCGEIFGSRSEIDNHLINVCNPQVKVKDKQTQTLDSWRYRNMSAFDMDVEDD